jgi:3-hydroxybutyryl-CoA dehydrogenase
VELLGMAARTAETATIATNTSSLSVSRLGEAIGAAERTLGTHYWNPPLLMPLVELVRGDDTDDSRFEAMREQLVALGKRPVLVEDVPGFVWNRLQLALLREALWVVENGVASAAAVDEVVRMGHGRRWRLTGPFETAALGGAHVFETVAANLFPLLDTATTIGDLGRWLPSDPDRLEFLRQRRFEELAAELRRDREAPPSSP